MNTEKKVIFQRVAEAVVSAIEAGDGTCRMPLQISPLTRIAGDGRQFARPIRSAKNTARSRAPWTMPITWMGLACQTYTTT